MTARHLLRFMSAQEAQALLNGDRIRNHNRHPGMATDSVGFCFAPVIHSRKVIYEHAQHLSGIVNMDVCLVGEIRGGIPVHAHPDGWKRGTATYSTPAHDGTHQILDEYSRTNYALADFDWWAFYLPNPQPGDPFIWSGSWKKPRPWRQIGDRP